MTVETRRPEVDLDYSIHDFHAGEHRDSLYLYRAVEEAMVALGSEVPRGRTLDVACGTGKLCLRIEQRGCTAIGLEASTEMIGLGRYVHPESRASMVRGIAETLPFADGSFDRVICQGSLDHFADTRAFMDEAARLINSDGRVAIALANFESVSCRAGRAADRLKRRLGRGRPPWRPYWEIPEDHNVKGDVPFVRALGGDALVLDRIWGISLFWLFSRYGRVLDRLPDGAAERIWRGFDFIARRRPQDSDMIISVWRKPGALAVAGEPLTQDYSAHELFAFAPVPHRPWWRNRAARISRWCNVAFSQSWMAVFFYRLRVRASDAAVPVVPLLCDLASRALFRVQIGKRVSAGPGLMIPHGNVIIDGDTSIGKDCQINPWVTIGLSNSRKVGFSVQGPRIGDHVHIGTGAKILGPLTIGDYARIGANAVVLSDVPAHATVVGAPARVVATASAAMGVGDAGEAAARLCAAIVDYRLHRCSLQTLVDMLVSSTSGNGALVPIASRVDEHVAFLDAAAAAGGDLTPSVGRSLDAIDAALRSFLDDRAPA